MTKNSNLYFLWCVPRSRSTAFEKMMAGTEQFKVIGEPFIDIYKQGIKSQQDFTIAKQSFDKKFAVLLSNSIHQPLFVKDMGYHATPFISDEQIKAARHAFLIRDPSLSIPSLYKMRQDFHENEAVTVRMYLMLKYLQHRLIKQLVIIFSPSTHLCPRAYSIGKQVHAQTGKDENRGT